MPKAKPDQVIVHRVELQETERATLEAALAGRFVTNAVSAAGGVFTGIGNMLAPLSGALTAVAAAYIAEKGISELMDAAKGLGEQQKQENLDSYTESGIARMDYFGAMVEAAYENDGVQGLNQLLGDIIKWKTNTINAPIELMPILIPTWFRDICIQFLGTIVTPDNAAGGLTSNPRQLWSEWLSIEEHNQHAYWHDTNGTTSGAVWKTIFG